MEIAMWRSNNIKTWAHRNVSHKSTPFWGWHIQHRVRNVMAIMCLTLSQTTAPSHAGCVGAMVMPNTLADLKNDLLAPPSVFTDITLDNENFTAPPVNIKFKTIDPAAGTFTGQIIFSQNRAFPISGKLAANGSSTFSISFSFRETDRLNIVSTSQYTGAIRAFEDANCILRYHIAGTFTVSDPFYPKFGPAPFSGTGFTVVVIGG
jgi:hypothetical protein